MSKTYSPWPRFADKVKHVWLHRGTQISEDKTAQSLFFLSAEAQATRHWPQASAQLSSLPYHLLLQVSGARAGPLGWLF